jgi:glycogen(starch) synthase
VSERDVILVGPYPPPFGGISAHIVRLAGGVRKQGLSVGIVNHFRTRGSDPQILADLRRNPWRYWWVLRRMRAGVVHYHHARWSTLLATACALRRSPASTVATVHGRELEPFLRSGVPGVAAITRWALRSFDVLIAVSAEIEQSLAPAVGHPVAVIPAYLPDGDDRSVLSAEADAFLRQGRSLVMAAYRLSVDGRGRTVYGLETAIGSFAAVAHDHPELRLAIFLASPPRSRRESHQLQSLVRQAGDQDVRRRIGVFYGQPLVQALQLATVYLRPTLTDGDAVSIREAMAAGLPVLASDVAARPDGVNIIPLERSRWAEEIDRALKGTTDGTGATRCAPAADPLRELIDIYDHLRPRSALGAEGGPVC